MNFGDIIGQIFRDSTGMPTKLSSYNIKLEVYEEISDDITSIEEASMNYLNEINNIDWKLNDANRIKLYSDYVTGLISNDEYVLLLNNLDIEKKQILNNFVRSTNLYFVTAYRNRLYTIKNQNCRNEYIKIMNFDSWFDMEEARELANLASLQIKSSDKYIYDITRNNDIR